MAAIKPEVEREITSEQYESAIDTIPTATSTFVTMPDMDMTLLTLLIVGRLPKVIMAAIETGSGDRHLEFR